MMYCVTNSGERKTRSEMRAITACEVEAILEMDVEREEEAEVGAMMLSYDGSEGSVYACLFIPSRRYSLYD